MFMEDRAVSSMRFDSEQSPFCSKIRRKKERKTSERASVTYKRRAVKPRVLTASTYGSQFRMSRPHAHVALRSS